MATVKCQGENGSCVNTFEPYMAGAIYCDDCFADALTEQDATIIDSEEASVATIFNSQQTSIADSNSKCLFVYFSLFKNIIYNVHFFFLLL